MTDISTFLERIAERQSSFVFFGDRLYDIGGRLGEVENKDQGRKGRDQKKIAQPLQATLRVSDLTFPLLQSVPFSCFEQLDEKLHAKIIQEDCASYVKEQMNLEIKAEKEVKNEKDRIMILEFIMHEFLPFLVSKKYEHDEILNAALNGGNLDSDKYHDPIERAREEIRLKLNKDFGTDADAAADDPGERMRLGLLKKEKAKLASGAIIKASYSLEELALDKKALSKSVLGEITAHQPLYLIGGLAGKAIPLIMIAEGQAKKEKGLVFSINKKYYVPASAEKGIPLADLARELSDRRMQEWRVDALEKSQGTFALIKELVNSKGVTQRQMHELAKLKEYDVSGNGFILWREKYLVYTTLPKFVTQDGRKPDTFWPFESTRVAISIGWSDGKPYTSDHGYVIEPSPNHPCLRDRNSGYSTLCNLDERFTTTSDLVHMIRKLSDTANVFMEPMNKPSLDSHSGHVYFSDHLDDILKQESMTREQAIAEGYAIVEVISKEVGKSG